MTRKHKKLLDLLVFISIIVVGVLFLKTKEEVPSPFKDADAVTSATILSPQQENPAKTVEAQFYEKLPHDEVKCNLCSKFCVLKEGQKGICKIRKNIAGKLYNIIFGKIVLHYQRSTDLTGFPVLGLARLDVSSLGCSAHCSFCGYGPWLFDEDPEDKVMDIFYPQDILKVKKKIEDRDNIKIKHTVVTGGEPFINYEYTTKYVELAAQEGMVPILQTAGYVNPEPFLQLSKKVGYLLISLKGFSKETYEKYSLGDFNIVLNNILQLKEHQIPFSLIYLIIPTVNDSEEEITEMATWIKETLGEYTPLEFKLFYPAYRLKNLPPTSIDSVKKSIQLSKQVGLRDVSLAIGCLDSPEEIQEVINAGLNVLYCPHCGNPVAEFYLEEDQIKIKRYISEDLICKWCGKHLLWRR